MKEKILKRLAAIRRLIVVLDKLSVLAELKWLQIDLQMIVKNIEDELEHIEEDLKDE